MNFIREQIKNIKPYIPGKPIEEIKRELGIEKELIKLASNENPYGPSPLALEKMEEVLKDVNYYPDNSVYYLRKKLSERFDLPQECIIVGNGSCELIHLTIKAFLNSGEKIVMSRPSFIMGKIEGSIFGGEICEIDIKDHEVDVDRLISSIDEKTKIVYIDNPNNPIGCIVNTEDMERILKKIGDKTILILDEAYYEYIERDDYPRSIDYIKKNKNVLALRTFSKIYGLAGLRIGYGFSNKEIINYLMRVRLPFNVNSLSQYAAIAALDDEKHIEMTKKLTKEGKHFLYKEFERLKIKYIPSLGNFITIVWKNDGIKLYNSLLKDGIIIRPLNQYGLNNHLRITIGTEEQNKYLVDCLSKYI